MATLSKTTRLFMRIMAIALIPLSISCNNTRGESVTEYKPVLTAANTPDENQSIMLALLLDTSNSMDGLIDQAKSQLWRIVNELAAAKCGNGDRPNIKIALYEYGNDGLSASGGYIRMVSSFTTDLDVISEKLFALRTNGGSEYCGQVISRSLNQLEWGASTTDLKMIFIAGNEPFDQGEIPYGSACSSAREKDVVVNTIFCGSFEEGIQTSWKNGADITGGSYMSIDHNRKTVYVPTPYDEKIDALNDRLNDTYIYYGKKGADKKEAQAEQDDNAMGYSRSNKVERAVSKSSHAYKNSSWDLVDASKDDEAVISKVEEEYLPAEMKGMNEQQRKSYVKEKAEERQKIQQEIQMLDKQRRQYISTHAGKPEEKTLDASMMKAIKKKGEEKKLSF